jgi:hypothetical protein
MGWFKDQVLPLLKHFVGTFIVAIVLFLAAIGLAYVEKWCVAHQMPEYLCKGTHVISVVIFCCDGVLICGTVVTATVKLLVKNFRNES